MLTRAALLAAVAGAAGVLAAWELAGAGLPWAAARLRAALRPLQRAAALGAAPSAPERRRMALVAAGVLLVGGWLLGGPLLAGLLAAGAPAVIGVVVRMRRRRWRQAVAAGAPLVARAVADALAGGHSIRGALGEAARHGGIPGPAGRELMAAARALDLGERTEDVLERLRRRAASPAWNTFAAAVLLQREAGGDLAGLLRGLAASLEASARVAAQARSATAQARFTGGIVAALPVAAAALAEAADPGALAGLLGSPATAALVAMALALEAAGLLAIRRLARPPR